MKMQLPPGYAQALSRRHSGREDITRSEILEALAQMSILWITYQKAEVRLKEIDLWWEYENIEDNYGTPKFYGAHRRLRNARERRLKAWKSMWWLMLSTDGNYEPFSEHHSISAADIHADFTSKYLKHVILS
jgi:hypothetical protein